GIAQRCEAYFRTGRLNGELQVRVEDAQGQTLASRRLRASSSPGSEFRPALRLDVPLWLTLGNLALDETESGDTTETSPASATLDAGRELRIARFEFSHELPKSFQALQSVDFMVVTTSRTAGESAPLLGHDSDESSAILQNWVSSGGHLLISV